MSNTLKKVKLCTICGKPIQAGELHTRAGRGIYAHHECFQAEQAELKAERLKMEGKTE